MIRKRHKIRRAPWAPSLVLVALALVTGTLSPAAPAAAAPRRVGGPAQNQPQGPQGQQDQECPTGTGRTAAASLGYRNAVFTDDFEGDADDLDSRWMRYASDRARHEPGVFDAQPGGSRDPNQVRVAGGVVTITGTPEGRTGGMSTEESHLQAYGLWEARVRLPADAVDYHSVMMVLAGSGANRAEMDFMEAIDPSGRVVEGHLHLPPEDEAGDESGSAPVQDNDWHNWAIEWTPERIRLYRDGVMWLQTRDGADNIPRERGHMTIQLDWFPGDGGEPEGDTELAVDWVRIYEQQTGTTVPAGSAPAPAECGTDRCTGQVNNLGQCVEQVENPNDPNAANCRMWEHPDQALLDDFYPNAPQGSVLLFRGCYDPATGRVTLPPQSSSAAGGIGPAEVRPAREDERLCELPASTQVTQVSQTNQQQANQDQGNQQQTGQACYYRLPANHSLDASVVAAIQFTGALLESSRSAAVPALEAMPPVGEVVNIGATTYVCVTNFPSGTNFPGVLSVPPDRRTPLSGGEGQGQDPEGRPGGEHDEQDEQDEREPEDPEGQPEDPAGQPEDQVSDPEGQPGGGTGGEHDAHQGAGGSGGETVVQAFGQQPVDDDTQGSTSSTTTPQGGGGGGGFSPGVVGDLSAGQQACLDRQTGSTAGGGQGQDRAGSEADGNGDQDGGAGQNQDQDDESQDQGDESQDQGDQSQDQGDQDPNPDDPQDGGDPPGTGGTGGTGGSGGLNQPDGVCAPATSGPPAGGEGGTVPPGGEGVGTGGGGAVVPAAGSEEQPTQPDPNASPDQAPGQEPGQRQPVTDPGTGNQVGACVRVQVYPVIQWDPGDGGEPFECAAPGTIYTGQSESDVQPRRQEAAQSAGCAYEYDQASTGEDGRPDAWPGKVSVVWRADWDACLVHAAGQSPFSAGAGHSGTFVDSSSTNIDLNSLGEGGQAPDTSRNGQETINGTIYGGQYNLGFDEEQARSATADLPREVVEDPGLNTSGDSGDSDSGGGAGRDGA